MAAHPVSRAQRVAAAEQRYPPFETRHLLWLLGFTVVATCLRLFRLADWSFWVDEAHTYRNVACSLEMFWGSPFRNYPLSFLLLRGLPDFMQNTEWGMRLPAVFFGIASVPALAIAFRGIVGRQAAVLAALFLAVSPWHLYWSQNARGYSMVLFFGVISLGAFYHGLERRSWTLLLVALVTLLLAGFSHTTAFLLLGAVVAYGLLAGIWRGPLGPAGLTKWYPLLVLGLLLLLTPLIFGALQTYYAAGKASFSLFHLVQTTAYFVTLPIFVAAVGGALWLVDRGERSALFLTSCVVLPLFGLAILASMKYKVTARYAFYTLPAFYVLAATLAVALHQRFTGKGFRVGVLRAMPVGLLVVFLLGQDYLYYQKQYGWRPRWREAVQFVEQHRDRLGTRPLRVLTTNQPSAAYYLDRPKVIDRDGGREDITIEAIEPWDLQEAGASTAVEYLKQHMNLAEKQGQELYVLFTRPELREMDKDAIALTWIQNHLHVAKVYRNWNGPKDMMIHIYHWRR
ncbi:MAG: glycosyltransferase family 39 protein [Planctomycetota bacterium]